MAAYAVQWGISFIIQSYYFDFSVFAQSNELAVIKVGSFLWVFLSIYIFLNFWLLTISAIRYYIFLPTNNKMTFFSYIKFLIKNEGVYMLKTNFQTRLLWLYSVRIYLP